MASTGRKRKTLQTLETLSRYQPDLNLEESDIHPEDQSQLRRSKESKTVATDSSSTAIATSSHTATATATAVDVATSAHIRSVTPANAADDHSQASQVMDKSRKNFEEKLNGLKTYRAKYGHCDVPKRYTDDKGLGSWCARMRTEYKKFKAGKNSSQINDDRIKQLEDMGFNWKVRVGGHNAKTFEEHLTNLVQFREAHGHLNVPYRYPSLGGWWKRMKKALKTYQEGKGVTDSLTEERVQRFQEVGVEPSEL